MTKIESLLVSGKNLFSLQDLAVIWEVGESKKLKEQVKYYLRKGRLHQIKRGIYSLKKEYSDLDLAQKLIPLSYITFHTALSIQGINFQYYTEIHSSSLKSRRIKIGDKTFVYHKIPEQAFYNNLGLIKEPTYTIASPERAIVESLLFATRLGFDHLDNIDKDKLIEITKLYENKRLEARVKKLIKKYF